MIILLILNEKRKSFSNAHGKKYPSHKLNIGNAFEYFLKNITLSDQNQMELINSLTGVEILNLKSNEKPQYYIKTLSLDKCNENWNYGHNGNDWECLVKSSQKKIYQIIIYIF